MFNKKGTALMQVLLVTVIIATVATFILRLSVSRTMTAAETAKRLAAKRLIEGCEAQIQKMGVDYDRYISSDPTQWPGPVPKDPMSLYSVTTPLKCYDGQVTAYYDPAQSGFQYTISEDEVKKL